MSKKCCQPDPSSTIKTRFYDFFLYMDSIKTHYFMKLTLILWFRHQSSILQSQTQ